MGYPECVHFLENLPDVVFLADSLELFERI